MLKIGQTCNVFPRFAKFCQEYCQCFGKFDQLSAISGPTFANKCSQMFVHFFSRAGVWKALRKGRHCSAETCFSIFISTIIWLNFQKLAKIVINSAGRNLIVFKECCETNLSMIYVKNQVRYSRERALPIWQNFLFAKTNQPCQTC